MRKRKGALAIRSSLGHVLATASESGNLIAHRDEALGVGHEDASLTMPPVYALAGRSAPLAGNPTRHACDVRHVRIVGDDVERPRVVGQQSVKGGPRCYSFAVECCGYCTIPLIAGFCVAVRGMFRKKSMLRRKR